jgi:hypothetical protein
MDGPRDGIAVLHVNLPTDLPIGSELPLEVEVGDDTIGEPFINRLILFIEAAGPGGGGSGGRTSSSNRGRGDRGGNSTLALPEVIPVRESEWVKDFHTFTENDALWIVRSTGEDDRDQLDFYVNVDNKFLRTTQKNAGKDANPTLLERQFMYALVLIGMAILSGDGSDSEAVKDGSIDEEGPEDRINRVTAALSPIILPMVDVLSSLSIDDVIARD